MGEKIEFNWILKLDKEQLQELEVTQTRKFTKKGHRIYPLEKLIDLVDEDFTTYGAIEVKEYKFTQNEIGDKITEGKYGVVYLCTPEEKEVLSKYNRGKYIDSSF